MFVEVKDPEDKVSRPLSPAEPSALPFPARPGRCWFFPLLLAAAAPLPSIAGCWRENPGFALEATVGPLRGWLAAPLSFFPTAARLGGAPSPPRAAAVFLACETLTHLSGRRGWWINCGAGCQRIPVTVMP